MDVALEGSRVINMQLISTQQNIILFGGFFFISGIILYAATKFGVNANKNIEIQERNTSRLKQNFSYYKNVIFDRDLRVKFGWDNNDIIARFILGLLVGASFKISAQVANLWDTYLTIIPFVVYAIFMIPKENAVIHLHIINVIIFLVAIYHGSIDLYNKYNMETMFFLLIIIGIINYSIFRIVRTSINIRNQEAISNSYK
jgi:hypothetical protein